MRDERFLEVVESVLAAGRGLYDSDRVRRFARMDADWPPHGRGLPIGALTSQTFAAHLYLSEMDHLVKRELKVPGYVRYVDDFYLFGNCAAELLAWRDALKVWLLEKRSLKLKHPDVQPRSCRGALHALGARITRDGIEALPRGLQRLAAAVARECWSAVDGERLPRWPEVAASRIGGLLVP
ncbi:MAG: RNA-directed DNA polymerase [Planctomycetes bacterium]|nr:RNA-directed DNA polymerase [Planctomycetota bacterium]